MARAVILAAGRGERMRPLSDTVPKPLLRAGGKPLIDWQIERLARGGFDELVVNHSHLGAAIEAALGDGSRYGVRIVFSHEPKALETAGGIAQALHLVGGEPFAVVSADIYTDFDYGRLAAPLRDIAARPDRHAAHFVLVDNRPWHPAGDDMGLAGGRVARAAPRLTYGNIAVFHPMLFRDVAPGTCLKLFPWAYRFVDEGRVSGERYTGTWENLGTPQQLEDLDRRLSR
ncbi:MAG TPA: nucleotidyltransferase family protein [Usitatibacter sp.]|nr:nucleotidyltransferase family protein [Usitatibacter sp.]